jgi:hypothetical protein
LDKNSLLVEIYPQILMIGHESAARKDLIKSPVEKHDESNYHWFLIPITDTLSALTGIIYPNESTLRLIMHQGT